MSFNNGSTYSKSYSRNNKRPPFGKRSPHPQSLSRPPPPKRIRTNNSYQSNLDNDSPQMMDPADTPAHAKSRNNNSLSRYNDTSSQTNSRYQGSRYNNNTSYGDRSNTVKRDETKAEFLSHLPKGPKSVETSRYNNSTIITNSNIIIILIRVIIVVLLLQITTTIRVRKYDLPCLRNHNFQF